MSDVTDFSVTSDIFLLKFSARAGKTMFCPLLFFGTGGRLGVGREKIVNAENAILSF